MINNDVLRSIRYMLDMGDIHVVELTQLADPAFALDKEQVQAWMKREDEPGFVACEDAMLLRFLETTPRHGRWKTASATIWC
jgi:uncharacterized protein YehS (DUF1456 family)